MSTEKPDAERDKIGEILQALTKNDWSVLDVIDAITRLLVTMNGEAERERARSPIYPAAALMALASALALKDSITIGLAEGMRLRRDDGRLPPATSKKPNGVN